MKHFSATTNAKDFAKVSAQMPTKMRAVQKSYVNGLAFAARKKAIEILTKAMLIRNPGFLKTSLKVSKTSSPDGEAVFGSVFLGNTDGFRTQEDGKDPARNRTMSLLSRGGSKSGTVRSANRLKPGTPLAKMSETRFRGNLGDDAKRYAFLAILNRAKYQGLFEMETPLTGPGVFRLSGRATTTNKNTHKGKRRTRHVGRTVGWRKYKMVQQLGRKPKGKTIRWMRQSKDYALSPSVRAAVQKEAFAFISKNWKK